ncbi:MAG: chromosome partitioning protein ParB [Deltaproteobacteria bacterium HGW-Deltaproteobacteria-14]|jgi:ParB family chromosome partitioning protein|nr:MAG: chromosome partitioning protein ParB [Deltaproteobacteria bacterium HGW-Deltaproteobacteria-14]
MNTATALGRPGRTALGKGLSALIAPPKYAHVNDDYFMCPVAKVRPDPQQPRQSFDDASLEELVASIKEKGILQPIVVRKDGADGYLVVAGERRLRASRKAGLTDVPVLVKDVASDEAFELALIENIQREDLNPIEEANAYQRLIDSSSYTQEVLARRLGKQRSTIANALRLLKLDADHQQLLIDRTITAGHARCLLAIDDATQRELLATRIAVEDLSVRDCEKVVREAKHQDAPPAELLPPRQKPASAVQLYCDQLAAELQEVLGAKVEIKARGRKGKLTVDFSSLDDLRAIHQRLIGSPGPRPAPPE